MSTEGISSTGSTGPVFTVTGLGSGLDTSEIISELMSIQREPVVHLTAEQTTVNAQKQALESVQSSLRGLSFATAELASPTLYRTAQGVTSSDSTRVSATATSGAAIGGYQVEVTKLANSARRSFTFASPSEETTFTIDGTAVKVAAGTTASELATQINSDSEADVYAAATSEGTIVLSNRETGETGAEYIKVAGAEGLLTEEAELAREGQDAEYNVDGVAGTSTSNTIKGAIPGVTLSLNALTTVSGPITVNVSPPALNTSAVVSQVEALVEQYNSVLSQIHTQLTTKHPAGASSTAELSEGTLFGDNELSGLVNQMREALYEPIAGLTEGIESLASIGISTGAASGSASYSQSSVEGHLQVNAEQLEEALANNPEGVQKLLQSWAVSFQSLLGNAAEPGGTIESRITADAEQSANMQSRITSMDELLTVRQEALQEQYANMEELISENKAQGEWLIAQTS